MVATSLAATAAMDQTVRFLDCDVEAPNAHLFLKPAITHNKQAIIPVPQIDPEVCTLCGRCVEVCTFHALAKLGTKILVFPNSVMAAEAAVCNVRWMPSPRNQGPSASFLLGRLRKASTFQSGRTDYQRANADTCHPSIERQPSQ